MKGRLFSSEDSEPVMRVLGGLILALLVTAAILICGYATDWGGDFQITQSAVPLDSSSGTAAATLNLAIVSGEMLGQGALGPAYVPSDFTVPAHSTVTVTVTDFDTATPLTGALAEFSTVKGTVGDVMRVQEINPHAPNTAIGEVRTVDHLAPKLVAHTLTVPRLGINVPMAGQSRTTFVIHTGNPGTYQWQCMDPCGSGPSGLGAPMGLQRYMDGSMTIVG